MQLIFSGCLENWDFICKILSSCWEEKSQEVMPFLVWIFQPQEQHFGVDAQLASVQFILPFLYSSSAPRVVFCSLIAMKQMHALFIDELPVTHGKIFFNFPLCFSLFKIPRKLFHFSAANAFF